jgi:hypothetical protein
VTHSRRSPRAAEKGRERLHAFRDRKRAEGAAAPTPAAPPRPAPPPAPSPFDNYESISTQESTQWVEGDRYPRFLLAFHSAGSRLAFDRNHPNPTNI